MSGTYELDTTSGDDARRSADRATRNLPQPQQERAYQNLVTRLQPPMTLAIDQNGRTITISSSAGPRATFDADGQTRNETGPYGRPMRTHAEFNGNRLSVSTSGDRGSDYFVTFESLNNGDRLRVTRRLDNDDLRQPVTVQSYYRRVSNEPRWDIYTPAPEYGGARRREPRPFVVPQGTRIVAVLDAPLSTRTSRSGERFFMTVQSPMAYQGARIEGVIARVTPYGPGRNADLRIDFDTMQLRTGQTAQFDGLLDSVRTPGGSALRVDTSYVSDRSRGDTTVEHGAIGAALGAIIGAIAAGGKGAAIGAVVGGASGAILAQDREEYLDLPPGTVVTIIVTPSNDSR